MNSDERHEWLLFRISDVSEDGFEIPKISKLLNDLSAAFYSIARSKLGTLAEKPGRRSATEERVAGVRLVRLSPGSMVIELAPPRVEPQPLLPAFDEPSPDEVAETLWNQIGTILRGEAPTELEGDVYRRVRAVIEDARDIGTKVEMTLRRRRAPPGGPITLRGSFDIRDLPEPVVIAEEHRIRRLVGHTYMVDVEPGRQRVRVKLPDGRDMTLPVDQAAAANLSAALDRLVEISVDEAVEGGAPTSRIVQELTIVVPEAEAPVKTLAELEGEQGVPAMRPDYVRLASSVWETADDVEEFERHLRELRSA